MYTLVVILLGIWAAAIIAGFYRKQWKERRRIETWPASYRVPSEPRPLPEAFVPPIVRQLALYPSNEERFTTKGDR